MTKDFEYFIALNLVNGLGSVKISRLLERFKKPENIFKARAGELTQVEGIKAEIASEIVSVRDSQLFAEELKLREKSRIDVLTITDERYPENLRQIYDPPCLLYVKGDPAVLTMEKLGIVGCRRASFYGLQQAERLSRAIVARGICVVSGLARGIDTAAHQGAVKSSGKTIAVLGSGLLNLYPPENKNLFDQIASGAGAVVSEFPLRMAPLRQNFPCRNRIISGLSRGIVVVEAARRSGSLITADLALSQGREVYAMPGAANSVNAQGTNKLIKDGAKLIETAEDIFGDLPHVYGQTDGPESPVALNDEEKKVLACLREDEPLHIDDLAIGCGQDQPQLYKNLLQLQLKGSVKEVSGKRFVKKGG